MTDEILFERGGGIASITLNRPAVRNAMTMAMCVDLERIVRDLQGDATSRVIILKANGTDFTVGADLKDMAGSLSPDPAVRARDIPAFARKSAVPIFTMLHALPQPIVASVRGHAVGVGAQLILAADIVVASETTKILVPQAKLAHPTDHGESWYLPRKIGLSRTLQMLLLAESVNARDAERYGLVNWVVSDGELEAKTAEIVQRLTSIAPVAAAQIKSLVNESLGNTLDQQFDAEMRALATCVATEDFPEALNAFVEKRKPVFNGR